MAENINNKTFTDDNFQREVLESSEPVLVDIWADWCGPCHLIAPVIDEVAAEFQGRAKVGKLNLDDNPRVPTQYGIRSIPTLLLFKDGQLVGRVVGVVSKKELVERLNSVLQTSSSV